MDSPAFHRSASTPVGIPVPIRVGRPKPTAGSITTDLGLSRSRFLVNGKSLAARPFASRSTRRRCFSSTSRSALCPSREALIRGIFEPLLTAARRPGVGAPPRARHPGAARMSRTRATVPHRFALAVRAGRRWRDGDQPGGWRRRSGRPGDRRCVVRLAGVRGAVLVAIRVGGNHVLSRERRSDVTKGRLPAGVRGFGDAQ